MAAHKCHLVHRWRVAIFPTQTMSRLGRVGKIATKLMSKIDGMSRRFCPPYDPYLVCHQMRSISLLPKMP